MRFRNQVVIITGAGSPHGVGQQVAMAFAREGARVVLSDLDYPAVQQTVTRIARSGGVGLAVPCDLSSRVSVQQMVDTAHNHYGTVDVLVNNATLFGQTDCAEMTEVEWAHQREVNIGGIYRCTQAVAPIMTAKGKGCVLNLAPMMRTDWGMAGYARLKAAREAVEEVTRSLAGVLGPMGITVNAIAPGFIWSSGVEALGQQRSENLVSAIPLRRVGEWKDVAEVALFLASDAARYMTGQTLSVDGGVSLGVQRGFDDRIESLQKE